MYDDPFALRTYAYPAPDRTESAMTDAFPHPHGPLRLYARRLLLLIIVCYMVLALLFIVSSRSFAAPLDGPTSTLVTTQDTAGAD